MESVATTPDARSDSRQDTLLVHDEAHLEPAFQKLIETIEEQQKKREPTTPWPKLSVMELTATTKSRESFEWKATTI